MKTASASTGAFLSLGAILAALLSVVAPPSPANAQTLAPGSVTATAPFQHLLPANATARIISYTTTLETGAAVEATATLYEPTAAWTGGGARPTIVFAPGTRGQGDQCAPSKSFLGVSSAWPGSVNVNYEYQFQQAAQRSQSPAHPPMPPLLSRAIPRVAVQRPLPPNSRSPTGPTSMSAAPTPVLHRRILSA